MSNKQILYHLGFRYGWYDDQTDVYFGSYSTPEKREEAKARYLLLHERLKAEGNEYHLSFLESKPEDGNWEEWQSELDVDAYPYE